MSAPDNGWWDKHYPDLGPRQRLRLWTHSLPDLPQHTLDNLDRLKSNGELNGRDQALLNAYIENHTTPPVVPTLSVTGPTSTKASTDVVWTLSLSVPTDHDVTGVALVTGQQDGDITTPATMPFRISSGQPSAELTISVASIVLTADRSLSVAFTGLVGVGKPFPPARTLVLLKQESDILPVMDLQPLQTVRLDPTRPTEVTAPVALDKEAPDDASAFYVVTGVAAEHFDGGLIPSGTMPVPKGGKTGAAKFRFAPGAGKFFQQKAVVSISRPVNATIGVGEVGFDVTGGSTGGKRPSGLPWPSGVCTSSNDVGMIDQIKAFATARGRPVDYCNVKANGNKTQKELGNAFAQKGPVYKALRELDIAISQVWDFVCDEEPDGLNRATAGAFDDVWLAHARMLASYGAPEAIRGMHELDGTPNWSAQKNPALFKAAWARWAKIIRSVMPNTLIDWNWLRSVSSIDYLAAYPGDEWVDIVGMDPYGNQDGLVDDTAFARYAMRGTDTLPTGPERAIKWALARGKKWGWAEWAVTNTKGPHTDRDSPAYIRGMLSLASKYRDSCAYEIYFHINDNSSQGGGHNHLLFDPAANSPDAAVEYRRFIAAGG